MKKTILLSVLAMLCFFFPVFSQPPAALKALKEGALMPELSLPNLLNYQQKQVNLRDLRGKLLLLDFWQTWCKACITGMPKLEKLRKQFEGKVEILSINDQEPKTILPFLKTNPILSTTNLPLVLYDRQLKQLFPHRYLPHLVWISADGTYLGASSSEDLNETTIQQVLATGKLPAASKSDDLQFDADKPLFADGNGGTPSYLYRSLLSAYQPGLPAQIGVKPYANGTRVRATNVSLYQLLITAMGYSSTRMTASRVVIQDSSLLQLIFPQATTARQLQRFCYEFLSGTTERSQAIRIMRQELGQYFSFTAMADSSETACWVLKINGDSIRSEKLSDIRPGNNLYQRDGQSKYIHHQPLQMLISYLNTVPGNVPVLDETNYTYPVNLILGNDLQNLTELNKALKFYGLEIRQERRNIERIMVHPLSPTENP
jgi:thiol-disulfide isomerase/thioredoxin